MSQFTEKAVIMDVFSNLIKFHFKHGSLIAFLKLQSNIYLL